jgi:hypothetical protein
MQVKLLLVAFLAFLGCNQHQTPVETAAKDGTVREDRRAGTDKKRENEQKPAEGSWEYQSKEHGLSITLPSSIWKERNKKDGIASFWSRSLSPMLAGIRFVRTESEEEFRHGFEEFKDTITRKSASLLTKPIYEQGTTASGDPYFLVTVSEKGKAGNQFIFVAVSHTWLRAKSKTVAILFEGHGKMLSDVFKSHEYSAFQKAARAICLSVKALE